MATPLPPGLESDFIPDSPAPANGTLSPQLMADFIPDQPAANGGFGNGIFNAIGQFNDAVDQFKHGAGDAVQNTVYDTANMLPGVNIPLAHSGSGIPYTLGNIAGNVGAFIGGGDILDAARLGLRGLAYAGKALAYVGKALPYVGDAMQWLGGDGWAGAARRALGSSAYGAVNAPNNRLGGALLGAGTSGIADSVLPTANLIGKGLQYIQPQKYTESILSGLGNGATREENAKSLAQDIQQAFNRQQGAGSDLYNRVSSIVPDSSIYSEINGKYTNLSPDIFDSYDRDLDRLHSNFSENPTFQNAHDLQSQLGYTIGKLQDTEKKKGLDIASRRDLQALQEARGTLRQDMGNYLDTLSPTAKNDYQNATDFWEANVGPYLNNPKIAPIAQGAINNPRNIANIFKNPEEDVQKIVSDLPQESQNKILYSVLGKPQASNAAESFLSDAQKLDSMGLGSYVNPTLDNQLATLAQRVKYRDAAQNLAGGILGASIGHHIFPGVSDLIGGGAGIYAAQPAIQALERSKLFNSLVSAVTKGPRASYPYARNIGLANYLANQGGQQ